MVKIWCEVYTVCCLGSNLRSVVPKIRALSECRIQQCVARDCGCEMGGGGR